MRWERIRVSDRVITERETDIGSEQTDPAGETARRKADMLFLGKKKKENFSTKSYDRGRLAPAMRCSICTGEKVAGFRDRKSGHFTEIMLIRSDSDLEEFRQIYGITEDIPNIY